jgi:membrane-associated protease RseP (regulator of RpoE activity)
MGPKRLWTGDWSAQSAAARARMAERRGLVAPEPEPVLEPPPEPAAPASAPPSLRERLRAGLARLAASARALAVEMRRPGATRVRLAFIALIAAAAGAGTVIGIQASSPSGAAAGSGSAWLGVEFGSPIGQAGAMVEFVFPGSPAEEGGLELGDVITAIDGRTVNSPQDAATAIGGLHPGDSATFAVERFGQPLSLRVTLGRRSGSGP